tara:strand:+ start:548 stop:940 length:393 start_codon:yes stop_codon:yes gene_type:complete
MSKNILQEEPKVTWISSRKLKRNLQSFDQSLKLAPGNTLKRDFTDGLWIYKDWNYISFRFVHHYQQATTHPNGYHTNAWGWWGELSTHADKDNVIHIHTKAGSWPSIEHFHWTVSKIDELLPTARRLYGL